MSPASTPSSVHVRAILLAAAVLAAAEPPAHAAAPKAGRDLSYNALGSAPRSPEEQRAAFRVPAGFEVELVAAESPGLGKFIGLS